MIASFSPTSALSNVDFPALGRPRMHTKPERKGIRVRLPAATSSDSFILGYEWSCVHTARGQNPAIASCQILGANQRTADCTAALACSVVIAPLVSIAATTASRAIL